MKIVCNSSVLITLVNTDSVHILDNLFKEILIPEAVRKEVFGIQKLPAFVRCVKINDLFALGLLQSNLDAGESEAICLYQEVNADILIIDDLVGRRIAERLGINISGTLSVLLLAKREKFIERVKPLLDKIINNGFRVADELYQEVLLMAGEEGE